MNQTRIDKIGVAAVVDYFCRMGYIDPHINFDDKIPVWDGNIDVHRAIDSNAKQDIEYNLYVQVKSSTHDSNNFNVETSHSIEVSDLKLYLEHRGTLLIKVLINKHKAQLYFAYLNKAELKRLIEECDEIQKTKTIKLCKAPKEYKDLIPHLRTMHLQGNYNIKKMDKSLENTNFTMKITTTVPKNENPFVWLASHPSDILINLPGFDEPFYLGDGPSYVTTKTVVKQPVSVNGTQFYTEFSIETQKYGVNLQIGESFRIEHIKPIENKKIAQVKITPKSSNIKEYIKELEFLLAINDTKSFYLADHEFKCTEFNLSPKDKEGIQREIIFSKSVVMLFDKWGLPLTMDWQRLTSNDKQSLEMLVNGLVSKCPVNSKILTTPIHVFQIANYAIVVGVQSISDSEAMLVNIYDCKCFRKSKDDNYTIECPILSYCLAEDKLGDNIEYSHPEITYDKLYKDEIFLNWANMDVLALIKKYDSTHMPTYLTCAKQICQWVLAKANVINLDTDFYFLNLMQIKVRQDLQYSREEILRLNNLAGMQDEKGFGSNVILKNITESSRLWDSFSEDIKSSLREFPIYTLYMKIKQTNNGETENAKP